MNGQPPSAPAPASQLSIISLVLGILSVTLCWFATGIPAVITGHIALSRIKRDPLTTGGRGMAIAGLVMGYISIAVVLVAVPAALLLPALAKAKYRAQQTQCVNNIKQITLAARIYANEHDEKFPENFLNMSNELTRPKLLVCPGDKGRKAATDWASYTDEDTSYEYTPAGFTNGPQAAVIQCPIHGNVGLADGSVQMGRRSKRGRSDDE